MRRFSSLQLLGRMRRFGFGLIGDDDHQCRLSSGDLLHFLIVPAMTDSPQYLQGPFFEHGQCEKREKWAKSP
jgi:hypothetical protein